MRSIALQEDKFISFQDSLHRCLQRYHSALANLSEAEVMREREREREGRRGVRMTPNKLIYFIITDRIIEHSYKRITAYTETRY